MDHKGDISLIIAHSKLNSGDNDLNGIALKQLLDLLVLVLPFIPISGIIGFRRDPILFQKIRQIVTVPLGQAVDNTASGQTVDILKDPGITFRFSRHVEHLDGQGLPRQRAS